MKLLILNGPNLNLLGKREPHIYGAQTFENYLELLQKQFPKLTFEYYQSNIEGELINKLHEVGFNESYVGIIFNPGGYTHTSIAIADAVAGINTPVVEVHISNTYAREAYRHISYLAKHTKGRIVGFGMDGYRLAVLSFREQLSN